MRPQSLSPCDAARRFRSAKGGAFSTPAGRLSRSREPKICGLGYQSPPSSDWRNVTLRLTCAFSTKPKPIIIVSIEVPP